MRYSLISSAVVALVATTAEAQSNTVPVTGLLGNATAVNDNPIGAVYMATLPVKDDSSIKGSITATAGPGGEGVVFNVNFSNLPQSGGPFPYHIHVSPITDGNCTTALGHLDQFIRGEQPPCDASLPQTCQVGDLSGKHGKITSDPFTTTYLDPFASTLPGVGDFFGNRSFVVHFANTTRITCANFMLVSATNGTRPTASTGATMPLYTGAASVVTGSLAAVLGVAGFVAFL